MIKILKNNSVQLCCKGKRCPIVTELADGMVEIVDDNGNRIVVRKEEALLISDGVKTIDEQKLILG
jgi:F0F1-type ATP synthase epsilon subunit